MMIDTILKLSGNGAKEFNDKMKSVDMTAINSRNEFLSDFDYSIDEFGVLTIDIGQDVILDDSNFRNGIIDAFSTFKKEDKYINDVRIQYSSIETTAFLGANSKDFDYLVDNNYYTKLDYYTGSISFEIAA